MSKEIIINAGADQTRIAIVENGELAELFIESDAVERTIGNLFLGKIRRIMPSIQAAFVDIGQKQDAFLHFSDLIDTLPDWLSFVQEKEPKISRFKASYAQQPAKRRRHHPSSSGSKNGSGDDAEIDDELETVEEGGEDSGKRKSSVTERRGRGQRRSVQHRRGGAQRQGNSDEAGADTNGRADAFDPVKILKKDQPILVRISKEPFQSKGSRVTTDISLAGRFLVLVPMANYVAVSKKIVSFKERRRLRALARSLVPEGFGVIVRTVAAGRNAKALDTDLQLLVEKWRKVEQKLAGNPTPPAVIHEDVSMASSIIRDIFSEDFDRILVDSARLFRNIKGYVQAVAPAMSSKVQHHTASQPIFKTARIDRAVEQAFESRADLPSGGYLFIEHTEAMHVIDVNSGRAGRGLSQEENSLRVNLEAVRLIARQIRLRDLGGILVIDFIDMRQEKNRRKVFDQLRREFRRDRAVTKVLPMSDFGLIQITRQRLRPSITTTFTAAIPSESKKAPEESAPAPLPPVREKKAPPIEPADLTAKIEDWLVAYREAGKSGPVKLVVHPFTAAFLNRKFPNQTTRWWLKHKIRIGVQADVAMEPLSFRIYDGATGERINTRQERRSRGRSRRPKQQQEI